MKQLFKKKFAWIFTLAIAALVVVPFMAFADTVNNDVSVGGSDTITAGGSTTVGYKIVNVNTRGGDTQNSCNPGDTTPATLTLTIPTGVNATGLLPDNKLRFTVCDVFQYVTFSSNTQGDHSITVSVSDSGGGVYTNNANFTLHVGAPAITTPTITWANPANIGYGTALSSEQLNATASVAGTNVPGTFHYMPPENTILNAGPNQTLHVEFVPDDLTKYNTATKDVTINVEKATASVTPNAASKTYGDTDPTLSGTLSGFLAADNVTATYSRVAGETVGSYAISAVLAPGGVLSNYDITYHTASFTINQRAASVTPDEASKTYGDADPALGGTLSGFLAADNVTASYSRVAGETVGSYAISAVLAPGGVLSNYDITYHTASFTINKKVASVTPNAASKTYGEADPTLSGTLTGFLAADSVSATYSRVAGETAGSYTISAVLSPAGVLSNYDITYNTASFTINKKVASVTPNAASKTYGEADPTLSGTLTGFLAADSVSATYSRVAGETVGSYAISVVLVPDGVLSNYDITYNTASFTISPRPITVRADAKSKALGAVDPALTYQITSGSLVGSDSFSGALIREPGESVGTYAIQQGTLALSSNYSLTFAGANLTIIYNWTGFFQPVDNNGTFNVAKAGSTIPVKFSLAGDQGLNILWSGSPSSVQVACPNTALTDPVEELSTATVSGLKYDPVANQYIYNWKTLSTYSGTCRQLTVKLADGTTHTANFKFTK